MPRESVLAVSEVSPALGCAGVPQACGHCEFQDLLLRYNVDDSEVLTKRPRVNPSVEAQGVAHAHDTSSPALQFDFDKCILCLRQVPRRAADLASLGRYVRELSMGRSREQGRGCENLSTSCSLKCWWGVGAGV